jgi:hypothetical protein
MIDTSTITRLLAVGSAVTGLLHLLVPSWLLRLASVGYDRVLAVDFEPRANATRRVRLLGVLLLAAAVALARQTSRST